jgi:Tol biopolymer transport system component
VKPLGGRTLTFGVGGQRLGAMTDGNGKARVTMTLFQRPSTYSLEVGFAEDVTHLASSRVAPAPFTVAARPTTLSLSQPTLSFPAGQTWSSVATLAMGGVPFEQQTIFFVATSTSGAGSGQTFVATAPTSRLGAASVAGFQLPIGTYNLKAYFASVVPIGGSATYDARNPRYVGSDATGAITITVPPLAIAFTSTRDGNSEIYSTNVDGSGVQRLTNHPKTDTDPVISPDGTKIAFTTNRDGNSEIYVMSADGTGVKRLTVNAAVDTLGSWSPDGSKIVFTSTRDRNAEIYTINSADGSGAQRLTRNSKLDADPAYSPDGTKIAFTSDRDGNPELYVMNTDGTGVRRLTNNAAIDTFGSWSPDGSRIAFASTRDGANNVEIYSMKAADGTDVKRLTNAVGIDATPDWSADGKKIVFSSSRNGNLEIYVMNADGTAQTRVTNNPALDILPDIR